MSEIQRVVGLLGEKYIFFSSPLRQTKFHKFWNCLYEWKTFQNNLNYAFTPNIQELIKIYNLPPRTKMLGRIKPLYQISDFHPLFPKLMLKLEENIWIFGPGSTPKINIIGMRWVGGGGGGGGETDYFSWEIKAEVLKTTFWWKRRWQSFGDHVCRLKGTMSKTSNSQPQEAISYSGKCCKWTICYHSSFCFIFRYT